MGMYERKAFLYVTAMQNGGSVDWKTGRITFPKAG